MSHRSIVNSNCSWSFMTVLRHAPRQTPSVSRPATSEASICRLPCVVGSWQLRAQSDLGGAVRLSLTAYLGSGYNLAQMKHVLVYLLILVNLASGVALAWDFHAEAGSGEGWNGAEKTAYVDHDQPPLDASEHGQHCSHGAAHFAGVIADGMFAISVSASKNISSPAGMFSSSYLPLLYRPPIV